MTTDAQVGAAYLSLLGMDKFASAQPVTVEITEAKVREALDAAERVGPDPAVMDLEGAAKAYHERWMIEVVAAGRNTDRHPLTWETMPEWARQASLKCTEAALTTARACPAPAAEGLRGIVAYADDIKARGLKLHAADAEYIIGIARRSLGECSRVVGYGFDPETGREFPCDRDGKEIEQS